MAQGGGSIAFDRAAGYYDATRRLPEEVAAAQTALLAGELAAAERVVEVGVGTGRVAIPLARAGVRVIGADLSAPMLHRLTAKAPGVVPVVVADATRLPFGGRTLTVRSWRTCCISSRPGSRPWTSWSECCAQAAGC